MHNAHPILIVGLGNPGAEYAGTRHNVGFLVVDALTRRFDIPVRKRGSQALHGEGRIEGHRVVLIKPMTFMNLSGNSVAAFVRLHKCPPESVWVVSDDAALPIGRLRIRPGGSSGGHNGLKSIEARLASREFPRFRIGVGGPKGEMVDHVLGRFRPHEQREVDEAIERMADAIVLALRVDLQAAMNEANRDPNAPVRPPKPKPEIEIAEEATE